MAEWRGFNASNEEDTCLWCGNKLRYRAAESHPERVKLKVGPKSPYYDPDNSEPQFRVKTKYVVDRRADKAGDYEDGFFCGLRCAYQFAVHTAQAGRRLTLGGFSVNIREIRS
jgi:hypothetical protein